VSSGPEISSDCAFCGTTMAIGPLSISFTGCEMTCHSATGPRRLCANLPCKALYQPGQLAFAGYEAN
jgi:hypothetical protein